MRSVHLIMPARHADPMELVSCSYWTVLWVVLRRAEVNPNTTQKFDNLGTTNSPTLIINVLIIFVLAHRVLIGLNLLPTLPPIALSSSSDFGIAVQKSKESFFSFFSFGLYNRKSINFWRDKCCGDIALQHCFPFFSLELETRTCYLGLGMRMDVSMAPTGHVQEKFFYKKNEKIHISIENFY